MKRFVFPLTILPLILAFSSGTALWAQPPATPELIAPPDLTDDSSTQPNVQNTTPLLQWVSQNASYSIKISGIEEGMEQVVFTRKVVGNGSYRVTLTDGLKPFRVYSWQVTAVGAGGVLSVPSERRCFRTGDYPWSCGDPGTDNDCDGISNDKEREFGTDPEKKTLFVRPVIDKRDGECHDWPAFRKLFPGSQDPQSKAIYFPIIKPFEDAGIEIVAVDCGFKIPPDLPCSVMQIVSNDPGIYCAYGSHSEGHIYFAENATTINENGEEETLSTWSWDRKGYTPKSSKGPKDQYYVPAVFPYPIRNYFSEGVYEVIREGAAPIYKDCYKDCNASNGDCSNPNWISPMNLDDSDPSPNPPFTKSPDHSRKDDTVEFNPISFDTNGKITGSPLRGQSSYDYNSVLKRTIVHEMGHAILGADEADHCANPKCIMSKYTLDWELHGFGGPSGGPNCEHQEGGRLDIRANGMIFNRIQ